MKINCKKADDQLNHQPSLPAVDKYKFWSSLFLLYFVPVLNERLAVTSMVIDELLVTNLNYGP